MPRKSPPRPRKRAKAPSVFINCPFDASYRPVLDALAFTIQVCGFYPRAALDEEDGTEPRIDKIVRLIRECDFSVHDISRTDLDKGTKLPRFNMPFELGLAIGAKRFGSSTAKRKTCLILDTEKYRYQKFLSDIAGQDIRSHSDEPHEAIKAVRDWLETKSRFTDLPGANAIIRKYRYFEKAKPTLLKSAEVDADELTFVLLRKLIARWIVSRAKT
ncbi:MAG: hypothetical protein GC199_07850 [Alphaproteobacteria bacterium]|nr:hypothetical protein [Alphaproteobacteria bacterium]